MRADVLETLSTADLEMVQKLQGQLISYDGVLEYLKEEIQ